MNLAPLWSNFRFKTGIGEKILDIFQYYMCRSFIKIK